MAKLNKKDVIERLKTGEWVIEYCTGFNPSVGIRYVGKHPERRYADVHLSAFTSLRSSNLIVRKSRVANQPYYLDVYTYAGETVSVQPTTSEPNEQEAL